jgi:hypothetical protein
MITNKELLKLQKEQEVLKSFSKLENKTYEIIFQNEVKKTQIIDFWIGDFSKTIIIKPNEQISVILELEDKNPNLIYLSYDYKEEATDLLESFKYLGSGLYEVIFHNFLSLSQFIDFWIGNYSDTVSLNPNEKKVIIVNSDKDNANLVYVNRNK